MVHPTQFGILQKTTALSNLTSHTKKSGVKLIALQKTTAETMLRAAEFNSGKGKKRGKSSLKNN